MKWWCAAVGVLASGPFWVGCSDKKPQPTITRTQPIVIRDVPQPLRGTVGAEATIRGAEPVLVSGFGLVSHLNSTGGGELNNVQLQSAMERELSLGGIGRGGPLDSGPMQGMTPKQVLRDPRFAVVIVEASIPPGSPANSKFDVRVRALPGSSVTSLEGGILWTTDLRIGPATVYGGIRTRRIATARGPIFINPFAEPGRAGQDSVSRTIGRILDGGTVSEPLRLELVLDNESHSRARAITSAINSRFPEGPGDRGPIARGRDGASIAVEVPHAFADKPEDFLGILSHLRVDQMYLNEVAKRTVDELRKSPEYASDLAWCLYAVGKPALPFLAEMYEYNEIGPRWAAVFAGAKLGDPRALPALSELAFRGPGALRTPAIELMGQLPPNPKVNLVLRQLLDAPDLNTKVAAYEALAERGDLLISSRPIGSDPIRPKFFLETVPSKDPLVYVTQQATPRIVIFQPAPSAASDPGLCIERPVLASIWSDRLIVMSESESTPLRLRFVDDVTGRAATHNPPEDILGFIRFMAHRTTPEDPGPGLDLTYSEVVGALYEIQRQGGVSAAFATETDRMMAELYKAARTANVADRPETTPEGEADLQTDDQLVFEPVAPQVEVPSDEPTEGPAPGTAQRRTWVVPLSPPPVKKEN